MQFKMENTQMLLYSESGSAQWLLSNPRLQITAGFPRLLPPGDMTQESKSQRISQTL